MIRKTLMLFFALACFSFYSFEIEGIRFPDSMQIGGKTFILNGAGLRIKKIAFIQVKIYAAGLYLEKKEKDAKKVLEQNISKSIVMKFIYSNVSKEKLVEAFEEGFNNNNSSLSRKLRPQVEQFFSFWGEMKEGDEAKMIYTPSSGTTILINDKETGKIEGGEFANLLFSVWLGEKPVNKELKESLLGK